MTDLPHFFSADSQGKRLVWVSFGSAILANIILWAILLGKFRFSGEPVPLHFNVVGGIDFVGQAWNLYQIPGFGAIVIVVNFLLASLLAPAARPLGWFLAVGSFAVQLLLLVGALALIPLAR